MDRKYHLYLVAGCRKISHLFYDLRSLEAVEITERYADSQAGSEDLERAMWIAESPTFGVGARAESVLTGGAPVANGVTAARLLTATELAYLTTLLAELNCRQFERVERQVRDIDIEWPDRRLGALVGSTGKTDSFIETPSG
ncbi:hypothetical protein J8F10_25925 [Gemmata sp. G18]|uniref:Uncharacterized protein n=1 Tax=Gemmata palustris TaxID=2822762 RepID=A0ABS5BYC3_9BACT|nr:hypothetical protein [Gemmata palustris]MBP3958699.1 hypothetical protein [Gemmata palustris]